MEKSWMRWFAVGTAVLALAGCAAELDAAVEGGEEPREVDRLAQAIRKGPFGLSQELNGRTDGTFENVEAFIDIYPEDGFTRVDFRYWNGGVNNAKVYAQYVVACEEDPGDLLERVDEYDMEQYQQAGWGTRCSLGAKAAVGFWIDN